MVLPSHCKQLDQGGGVVNLVVVCPDDLGHRDVTERKARNFEEFSKMAPLASSSLPP